MSGNITKLDLRDVPVTERHPRIFDAWEALEAEDTLQIVNDHDPKPLYYQFQNELGGLFKWDYVSRGPQWVVNLTKVKMEEATGEELRQKVVQAIEQIRPHLQADGGDVELVDIDEGEKKVLVRLTGACGGCPSAALTLKAGVERTIREFAPEIKSVEEAR